MDKTSIKLENYSIIYASQTPGLDQSAEYLQKKLIEVTGITLNVYADNDSEERAYEILIGSTSRGESADFTRLMSYDLSLKNEKIVLGCGGHFTANYVIDLFVESLLKGEIEPMKGSLLEVEKQPFADGSNLRVMTANILAQRWICGGRPYITVRAEIYAAVLAVYAPDFIGVQETDDPWNEFFPYYLDILRDRYDLNYGWTCNRYGELSILTSIMYNKDKFSLLETDMQEFSYMNSTKYKLRVLSSAVLENVEGNERYLVVNTHWSGKQEDVYTQINAGIEVVDHYKEKYNIKNFFCTGDYNMHRYGFNEYKEVTGYLDAKEVAEASGTLVNHNCGIREGMYIDHIFHTPGLSVKRYETVDKNYTNVLSDHLPQYADFIIE